MSIEEAKELLSYHSGRNENVNTEVLVKICKALECNIEDIMEIVDEE